MTADQFTRAAPIAAAPQPPATTADQVAYEVARIEAPSWFGETAIVTKEKRNASVHAGESGMTLLVMTREDFLAAKRLTHDEMEDKAKALR